MSRSAVISVAIPRLDQPSPGISCATYLDGLSHHPDWR